MYEGGRAGRPQAYRKEDSMNKSIKCLISALALAVATSAHAGALVNVSATSFSKVFVDGRFVGMAPIAVRTVGPGWHTVMVQHARRGEARAFRVFSPPRRLVSQQIVVDWRRMHRVRPVAVVAEPVGVVEPMPVAYDAPVAVVQPVVQPAYVQPAVAAPVAQVAPPPPVDDDAAAQLQAERDKNNTTKALLGVAVANELLNRGKSKKVVRGVTLGGALLNSVVR
jgi:hypothetical protein